MKTMKKTKLALAMSLTTLLAVGCGSSSSGDAYTDTVFDIENTYWDLAAASDDSATIAAIDSDDVIAYYFEGSADDTTGELKIYSDAGYVTSDYSIIADITDTSTGSIAFDVAVAAETDGEDDTTLAVVCDFAVDATTEALTLSSCDTADYDAEIAAADADTIAVLAELTEIVDPDDETTTVSEDFESYDVDTDIGDVDGWSSYNTDGTTSTGGTLIAEVSSDQSLNGSNSLYIFDGSSTNKPFAAKTFSAGAAATGSVTFNAYIPDANEKTTYVHIGVGKNNSDRFFELRISGSGTVGYESGEVDTDIGSVSTDAWAEYTLAWAPSDDGSDTNITVTIDGVVLGTYAQTLSGLTATNIPSQLTMYTGDTSGDDNAAYFDDLSSDLF